MSSEAAFFPNAVPCSDAEPSGTGSVIDGLDPPASGGTRDKSDIPQLLLPISDEQLMEQIQDGDREALGYLFRRYASAVRKVAIRILRDEAEADDLVQEVFLFLFRKAALYNPEKGTALTWILHVAYHRAFDRRRYLNTRKFYAKDAIDEHAEHLAAADNELPFHAQSWDGILGRKLADRFRSRLTPEQQETLQLFFFEGYALKEIAEVTGRTLVNVRSHYYRGLERLRKYIMPEVKRPK